MDPRIIITAVAVVLGVHLLHLLILLAAAVIVVTLTALLLKIALIVAEDGPRIQPCRRRFAW